MSNLDSEHVEVGLTPLEKVVHFSDHLVDGSSVDMDVDGSSVNVEFSCGPPAGQVWYINEIGITLNDSGNNTPSTFGAISGGLTNGVLVETQIDSTDYEFDVLKDNTDIVEGFTDHFLRGQTTAFINSTNFFSGKLELIQPITLVGDDSDVIKATVRDDLTGLDFMHITVEGFRVV